MKYLFIAGHGPRQDGSFDPGAKGFIKEGEHLFYKELIFPLMKKSAPAQVIFHDSYNVYDRKNIVDLARSYGKDIILIEWHFDAWKPQASGGHVIVHSSKDPDATDKAIRDVIEKHIGLANRIHKGVRGIDGRSDLYNPNACARHGVNYRLVELGFGTNERDASIMVGQAQAIARDMVQAITGQGPLSPGGRVIAGQNPSASLAQMQAWARKKGASQVFIDLAETFYQVALGSRLDPVLLYAQSALETNYMKFGGVLDATFNNPCGLKTREGGANSDPGAHQRFSSWDQGIKAQADHLNLYAGAPGYPMADSPDPRHFAWILGTAKTVEALSGRWASDLTYGGKIITLMDEIRGTQVESPRAQDPDLSGPEDQGLIYAVAYAHANDGPAADFLANALQNKGYQAFSVHTSFIDSPDLDLIIQVGGAPVQGASLILAGQNEEATSRKVMAFIEDELGD